MNRGRRSEAIFSGKEDFQMFIALLEETAKKNGVIRKDLRFKNITEK
jgi:hypothetical protein